MNIGLDKIAHANVSTESMNAYDEYIDEVLSLNEQALHMLDEKLVSLENLAELRAFAKAGKKDVVKAIIGCNASVEQIDALIASNEDFASTAGKVAAVAGDVSTYGLAGNIKQLIDMFIESNNVIGKQFFAGKRKVQGMKITDDDIKNTRAATLLPYNSWMRHAELCLKITAMWQKITPSNAYDMVKDMYELSSQLGYKSRFLGHLFGHVEQGVGDFLKDRYSIVGKKAGDIGWTANGLKTAIPICEKLINARVSDLILRGKDADLIENLNKSGVSFRQFNRALSIVGGGVFHEIGKLVRGVNKLMKKIN